MKLTFTNTIKRIAPHWLQRQVAGAILGGIGQVLDAAIARNAEAVKRRFPGVDGAEDALGLIAADRVMRRAPGESAGAFSSRLTQWLPSHRRRGNPYSLTTQLHAWYGEGTDGELDVTFHILYNSGRRFVMGPDGNVSRDVEPGAEDFSGAGFPGRWWLFYFAGEGVDTNDIKSPLALASDWNSANGVPTAVVIPYNAAQPVALWGYPVVTCDDEAGLLWTDEEPEIYQ